VIIFATPPDYPQFFFPGKRRLSGRPHTGSRSPESLTPASGDGRQLDNTDLGGTGLTTYAGWQSSQNPYARPA